VSVRLQGKAEARQETPRLAQQRRVVLVVVVVVVVVVAVRGMKVVLVVEVVSHCDPQPVLLPHHCSSRLVRECDRD
jgi:hypothetical protein